ncbi:MAG: urease accessory protein UreD [Planctomycetota bacterium]|nr:MAG: urease accessory protein UreD [Planctomycetota bacterium]
MTAAAESLPNHAACAPGQARAQVHMVDGLSSLVQQQARAPAKLLAPVARGPAVWLCQLSFGGGVVAGDHLDTALSLGAGASALLSTQGATKIYKDPQGRGARQSTRADLAAGSLLAQIPHPITAYAHADYTQDSYFHCQPGASCCWWECLSAGRPDQGEHWSAQRVRLSTTLSRGDTVLLRDRLCLEGEHTRAQLGPWRCCFSLGFYGPRCQSAIQALGNTAPRADGCSFSLSPFPDGALLRGLARDVEAARACCRQHCQWLGAELGDDPWARLL